MALARRRLVLLSLALAGVAAFAALVIYLNSAPRTLEGITDEMPQAVFVRDILINPIRYQGKLVRAEGILSAAANGRVAYFLNDQGASVILSLPEGYDARSLLGRRVVIVGVVEVEAVSIRIVVRSLSEAGN